MVVYWPRMSHVPLGEKCGGPATCPTVDYHGTRHSTTHRRFPCRVSIPANFSSCRFSLIRNSAGGTPPGHVCLPPAPLSIGPPMLPSSCRRLLVLSLHPIRSLHPPWVQFGSEFGVWINAQMRPRIDCRLDSWLNFNGLVIRSQWISSY
jgi:hypothetical protein